MEKRTKKPYRWLVILGGIILILGIFGDVGGCSFLYAQYKTEIDAEIKGEEQLEQMVTGGTSIAMLPTWFQEYIETTYGVDSSFLNDSLTGIMEGEMVCDASGRSLSGIMTDCQTLGGTISLSSTSVPQDQKEELQTLFNKAGRSIAEYDAVYCMDNTNTLNMVKSDGEWYMGDLLLVIDYAYQTVLGENSNAHQLLDQMFQALTDRDADGVKALIPDALWDSVSEQYDLIPEQVETSLENYVEAYGTVYDAEDFTSITYELDADANWYTAETAASYLPEDLADVSQIVEVYGTQTMTTKSGDKECDVYFQFYQYQGEWYTTEGYLMLGQGAEALVNGEELMSSSDREAADQEEYVEQMETFLNATANSDYETIENMLLPDTKDVILQEFNCTEPTAMEAVVNYLPQLRQALVGNVEGDVTFHAEVTSTASSSLGEVETILQDAGYDTDKITVTYIKLNLTADIKGQDTMDCGSYESWALHMEDGTIHSWEPEALLDASLTMYTQDSTAGNDGETS